LCDSKTELGLAPACYHTTYMYWAFKLLPCLLLQTNLLEALQKYGKASESTMVFRGDLAVTLLAGGDKVQPSLAIMHCFVQQ
jgi:hypothetical protein